MIGERLPEPTSHSLSVREGGGKGVPLELGLHQSIPSVCQHGGRGQATASPGIPWYVGHEKQLVGYSCLTLGETVGFHISVATPLACGLGINMSLISLINRPQLNPSVHREGGRGW